MERCYSFASWARVRVWSPQHHRVLLEANTTTTSSRSDHRRSNRSSSTQHRHLVPAYLTQRAWRRTRHRLLTTTHTRACWPKQGKLMSSWVLLEGEPRPTTHLHTGMAALLGTPRQLEVRPVYTAAEIKSSMCVLTDWNIFILLPVWLTYIFWSQTSQNSNRELDFWLFLDIITQSIHGIFFCKRSC